MNIAGGRTPAGGAPGGAYGCRGQTALSRNRPGAFVNHLFLTFQRKVQGRNEC